MEIGCEVAISYTISRDAARPYGVTGQIIISWPRSLIRADWEYVLRLNRLRPRPAVGRPGLWSSRLTFPLGYQRADAVSIVSVRCHAPWRSLCATLCAESPSRTL